MEENFEALKPFGIQFIIVLLIILPFRKCFFSFNRFLTLSFIEFTCQNTR